MAKWEQLRQLILLLKVIWQHQAELRRSLLYEVVTWASSGNSLSALHMEVHMDRGVLGCDPV